MAGLFFQTNVLRAQATLLPKPEIITARQGLPQAFVPAIVQDKRGFIWMATRDGLARYDGYTFKVFQPAADGSPSLSSPGLTNLTMAPDGYIWIQNDQFGLDGFDPVRETFTNLSRQPAYRQAFRRDTLLNVYPDSHQRLWLIFRRKGLASYDLNTNRLTLYPAENGPVMVVVEDGQQQLWQATAHGLARFDPAANRFIPVGYPRENNVPITDLIRQLYRRPNGELWLCSDRRMTRWNPQTGQAHSYTLAQPNEHATWTHQITSDSQGVEYLNLDRQVFRFTEAQGLQLLTIPDKASLYVSLFVDKSDVLWMGTDLAGVQKINLRAADFQAHPYRRSFADDWLTDYAGVRADQLPNWPAGTTAYNFRSTIDKEGQLWFAVGGTPLYRLSPVTHMLTAVAGPVPLRDYQLERPTLLATDPDGNVWLVHPDWTGYYDTAQNRWVRVNFSLASIRSAMLQTVVDRQAVWIATVSTGLYRIDRRSGRIRHYQRKNQDTTSLSSDNLYWLNADPLDTNQLWIGTFGSGLCRFDKRSGQCTRITTRQGLPNNVVYAAIPDRWGSVWLATNQGLGQFNRRTGHIRVYRQEDGLGADEFNRFHAVTMPDGRIVLGTISGLVGFNPRSIRSDTFQPVVQVSDVLVNNRSLMDSLLKTSPSDSIRPLILPYNQNFITVRFAAMQYNRLGQALYRYRLGGLSPGWVVTQRPEAIFTAIPPGTYQLQIQAANAAGQWSRHVRELTITVRSPWWQTGWAYLAYGLLAAAGIWMYIQFRIRQIQQRQQQVTQQREAEQLRSLDELKTRFFTNLTHELRTPLTLILGPAQQLRAVVDEPVGQKWVSTIERNAHRILDLTNQLLDLSRLEAGVVPITEQPGDLSAFVAQLVESVRPEAEKNGLTLTLTDELTHHLYRFDADKLERIGLNLLSNAIKFTCSGNDRSGHDRSGHVAVRLRPLQDIPGIELTVEDNGPGLTADEQAHVFDRYYQAAPTAPADRSASSPGSGIGLSLVKELVTLQGGTVWVQSAGKLADGQTKAGSRFVVQLPYRIVQVAEVGEPLVQTEADEPTNEQPVRVEADEQPLVLIVEDNPELRAFIRQSLAMTYRIGEAEDGLKGWEAALELGPDLIVSDVMMPGMDGFSLCRKIKEDPRTSHIPVVLLTAKTTLDDRLQGLTGGADDYLTKPFHPAELQLRVRNLLAQQQRQRTWLQHQLTQPADGLPETLHTPTNDTTGNARPGNSLDPFTDQLQNLLAQYAADAKFGVEELAQAMGMSRVHLYRKVKAISGFTAAELVRNYRLGQATRFLRSGRSVADTAEAVGFDSPGYFAKCFRERYGQSPTDFQHDPGTSLSK